jgi:hypothetical protein
MKKFVILTALILGFTVPVAVHGQAVATGESHPENLPVADQPDGPPEMQKPSPAIPAVAPTAVADAHAPVLPADGMDLPAPRTPKAGAEMADSGTDNTDDGIVTRVPYRPGELAEGTILRTHLDEALSTSTSQKGDLFTARLTQDILQDGKVIIPIGSSIQGRITKVVENRRIQGRAKLRLRADTIILPDGSRLMMHAQVIDTSDYTHTKTDSEGTIVSRDDAKKNWEIAGATTGTGAVSGAVIGGGVGAVVGTVIGAGVGASHYMMAHPVASLPRSSTVVFQLTEPMSITPLQPIHE